MITDILPFFRFRFLLACCILSTLVGTSSALFLYSLDWITKLHHENSFLIFGLPLGGLLIVWLYANWGKDTEKGNNHVIDVCVDSHAPIVPLRISPLIYITTLITHVLGGSAGREGTAVQIASGFVETICKYLNLEKEQRSVLMMGAIAAGFGSVFGTPWAGAIFAVEVCVRGKIQWKGIFTCILCALLANFITDCWQIHHSHFEISFYDYSADILWKLAFASIAFGLCARLYKCLYHKSSCVLVLFIPNAYVRVFVGGIVLIVLMYLANDKKYSGLSLDFLNEAFLGIGLEVFAWKMILTILTLTVGFKGGEVTPLFVIGATLGGGIAEYLGLSTTELFAGMGLVAVFAGAVNTPWACVILAIELFGWAILPFAIPAVWISYLISGKSSIYESQRN
ncbi:MAG: chloride channel protein [Leadbetterella sp.]